MKALSPVKSSWLKLSPFIAMTLANLVAALHATPSRAAEGQADRGGNGGISIVCRDASGTITSVRLLDMAEAGETAPSSTAPAVQQFQQALDRLRKSGRGDAAVAIELSWSALAKQLRIVGPELNLEFTHDANTALSASGKCRKEQLAVFRRDLSELYIRQDLYHELTPTNQAALMLHESAYRLATDSGREDPEMGRFVAENSDQVRLFVRTILDPSSDAATLRARVPFDTTDREAKLAQARDLRSGRAIPLSCNGACKPADLQGSYLLLAGSCAPAFRISAERERVISTHKDEKGIAYGLERPLLEEFPDFTSRRQAVLLKDRLRLRNHSTAYRCNQGQSQCSGWLERAMGSSKSAEYGIDLIALKDGNLQVVGIEDGANCLYQRRAK